MENNSNVTVIDGEDRNINEIQVRNASKMESDIQIAQAIKNPRNEMTIFSNAIKELEIVPEFANKAFYSIPYKDQMGETVYVEGPSIKAAMSLARRWGNCATGARIVSDDDDRVIVEGIFWDYETNMRSYSQYSVAKKAWSKKTKQVIPLREDRLNMAIQSGMSKAQRNAILKALPVYLTDKFFAKAKEISSGKNKDNAKKEYIPTRFKKAKDKFMELGITESQWEAYLSGLSIDREAIIEHLIGLYNAIKDGETKLEDVFPQDNEIKTEGKPIKAEELFTNNK